MGCDIHMFVEALDENKEWQFVPAPEIELYFYPQTMKEPAMGSYWYWGRNYTLFGFLADVRNDMDWNTSYVTPLSGPRGIPQDASAKYRKVVGGGPCCELYTRANSWAAHTPDCDQETCWGADGHSHSWFTIRELRAVDYDQAVVQHRGWLSPAEFKQYQDTGSPTSWRGGVGGGGVKYVSNEEMANLIAADPSLLTADQWSHPGGAHYYTELRWTNPLSKNLGPDWFEFLDRASKLTHDDGSDVRAVFFFDN